MQTTINTVSTASGRAAGFSFARAAQPARRLGAWLRSRGRERAVLNELERLTDRELADIGLARGDIRMVFARAAIASR